MLDYRGGANKVSDPARVRRVASAADQAYYKEAWLLAWRRKGLILALTTLGALGGFVASKTLVPRYVATAQIYLDPHGLPGLDKEDSASHEDSTGFINFVETQAKLLTSRLVLDRVVTREGLATDPEFRGDESSFLSTLLGRSPFSAKDSNASLGAQRTLGQRVVIRRPERTFIIEISASSSSPDKAARIANSIAQAYGEVRVAMQSEAARQATNSFSTSLGEMRDRLITAEKQVEDYKATNGLIGAKDEYIDQQSLKELNQQLNYARTRLEDARSRFEQLQHARASSPDLGMLTATLNAPTLTNLRAQQATVLEKAAELSAELGPMHPSVKNAQARKNELHRLIDIELERIRASSRKDLEQARGVEQGLRRDVEQLRQRALTEAQASVRLRDLEREVDVNRGVYQSFFARSRQTAEAQPSNLMSTHIVTMASPPAGRSFPPSAGLMMAGGGILGSLLGGALGLGLEMRRGANAKARPSTRVNGLVRRATRFKITDATSFTTRPVLNSGLEIELGRIGIPVVTWTEGSREIDLVTGHLVSLIDSADEPPIISLIGGANEKSRTLLSVNIALSLSSEGLDIALVDANANGSVLRSAVEHTAKASRVPSEFVVQTRDEVIFALPNFSGGKIDGASADRILRGLARGEKGPVDAIICDGLFEDSIALERINWVVLVLNVGANKSESIERLPPSLAQKIAFVLCVTHSNPWAKQGPTLKIA